MFRITAIMADAGDVHSETLTAAKTLTRDDKAVQKLDPGGTGRDVTLPAEEYCHGKAFLLWNTADAAEDLTVKNDAATPATVCTVSQNESADIINVAGAWLAKVHKLT